jgi:Mn2+/Fe2+ NRAMP family transporter
MGRGTWKALGPGFLFAAVSVGVSHLVQSTRAGAGWGLTLLPVIVLAMVLKYPLFEFGQRYAVATGTSLLDGYRRLGRWSLVLYMVLTLATMFTVVAAVTVVSAALAVHLTGLHLNLTLWSAILLVLGGGMLILGRYPLLDRAIKAIMAVLAVSAVLATILVVPRLFGHPLFGAFDFRDKVQVGFLVGLVGWMPTGVDVTAWQSFWSLARRRQTGHAPTLRESSFDFKLGYVGTGVLALLFCVLGAAVMFAEGRSFPDSAVGFAARVIDLFTEGLGEWSRPIIVVAAFTTMFSTVLTVLDGFPRALQLTMRRFRGPEEPEEVARSAARAPGYWVWLIVLCAGAMPIVAFLLKSLTRLIDLATFLSFLTGPLLGWLALRAVTAEWVKPEFRPGPWLRRTAYVAFAFLGALFVLWLDVKLRG